jgi:hypothetical protein
MKKTPSHQAFVAVLMNDEGDEVVNDDTTSTTNAPASKKIPKALGRGRLLIPLVRIAALMAVALMAFTAVYSIHQVNKIKSTSSSLAHHSSGWEWPWESSSSSSSESGDNGSSSESSSSSSSSDDSDSSDSKDGWFDFDWPWESSSSSSSSSDDSDPQNDSDDSDSTSSDDTVIPAEPYDVVKAYSIKQKVVQAEETNPMEVASAIVQQERLGHDEPGN